MGIPISNVTRRVVYAASGTGPYNFTFEILAAGDVAVYKDDALLTITTDYTVTINANGTGYITLTASPTGATQIAIVGNRTIQRTTDFVTGGDFFANTVNDEMDQQTIFAQQNAEAIDRALKAPQTDPTNINMTLPRASLRAGKTLAFDAQGNPSLGDTLGTNRGNWASGTLYYVRDIVKDTTTSNVWQCLVQHTSSGTQPISTNTDAAKWFLLVDAASAGASATAAAASASAAATSASNASTSASNAASSASTASTQASNASTSATNAANSATAAASSASTASTQASNAATSATNAANSATSASNSASTATTQATNASNSATSAATSASQASTSASNAASSASTATTQASNAATSATNAANSATASASSATNSANSATASANSATAAAGSATSAAASAAAAAASLDNFDDRYLGAKASNPTVDNDGDPLVTGALYYRTTAPIGMKVWDGSQWLEASAAQQASLVTYEYVATAGQTTFSGADANAVTLSYTVGNVFVSVNGVRLRPGDDFTASTGTSVVLAAAAAAGDEVVIDAFRTFDVANTYTQTQSDSRFVRTDGGNGVTLASGNLGLGVTPSAWQSGWKAMQIGAGGGISDSGGGNFDITNNYYRNSGDFYIANGYATLYRQASGQHRFFTASNNTSGAGQPISFTQAMTLDASGNLGLGVTPSAWTTSFGIKVFDIASKGSFYASDNDANISFNQYFNGSNAIYKTNGAAGRYAITGNQHEWRIAPSGTAGNSISFTTAMTLDSSGNLLVGTTSAGGTGITLYKTSGNATAPGLITFNGASAATEVCLQFLYNGGQVGTVTRSTTATAYNTSSDYRLKENIQPMTGALAKVAQLKPCTYKWKADGSDGEGFIAHELQEVCPDAVTGEKDAVDAEGKPVYQGIDTSFLVATLTAALQEAVAEINKLKADVAALKGAA